MQGFPAKRHLLVDDWESQFQQRISQESAHKVEALIKNELEEVADVVIHVEPFGKDQCE